MGSGYQSGQRDAKIEQNIFIINNTINIEKVEISKQRKGDLPSVRRSLPNSIRSGSKDLTDEEAANETLRDYMKRKVTETQDLARPIGLTKTERSQIKAFDRYLRVVEDKEKE